MNTVKATHTASSITSYSGLPVQGSESWRDYVLGIEKLADSVAERFAATPAERDDLRQVALLSLFDTVDWFAQRSGLDFGHLAAVRMVRDLRRYRTDRLIAKLLGGTPVNTPATSFQPCCPPVAVDAASLRTEPSNRL